MSNGAEPYAWWASLKHGGLLLAPAKLAEVFPETIPPLSSRAAERLRRDLTRLNGDAETQSAFLDTVLEQVLELGKPLRPETGSWLKGGAVPADWTRRAMTGEAVKPRRVWQGENGAELPIFWADAPRLGVGRGRRWPARVIEWLRKAYRKLALITNGRQWRLVHASLDADAFAEWDADLWFEEGGPGPQVTALRMLLARERLVPPKEAEAPPLLAAIEASRKGQAELSQELGERVRRAVELLIQTVLRDERLPEGLAADSDTCRAVYVAATRIVMRMVVVLFAEARDLLPRDNPVYHLSYGLQGLRESLDRASGGGRSERLRHHHGAWARALALFRLVHDGSPHEAMPVLRYGGGLFEAGDPQSTDTVRRALAAFEDPERGPNDAVVHRILELLCRSRVKVRQGKGAAWVEAPVDFSDLSSEYIGILYEGLLDYELRRAEADDPIVFLNLGDQPALPLSRLEAMDDKSLPALVEKFKVKKEAKGSDDEEEDEQSEDSEEGDEAEQEAEAEENAEATRDEEQGDGTDLRQQSRERARAWAHRAVAAGKLVAKPRKKSAAATKAYEAEVDRAADALVSRVVLPGEWFLVRWGGTRKGSGTFYTRPQLTVPLVKRTLAPLAYDPPSAPSPASPAGEGRGEGTEEASFSDLLPKKPEQILRLKVCDPAMGSGSFLVASLRFLTDSLFASLFHHGRIQAQGDRTLVTLAEGKPSEGKLSEETLPCPPDAEDFEARLRARLKRYVVERCLYGVDVDPLAVELARLSLWVETMDRELPFEFLDHKLKAGNSLVGCWFDTFRDYPALAWEREGGDKSHSNGVHFAKETWTKAIKKMRGERIKPELADWIAGQRSLLDTIDGRSPDAIHDAALAAFEEIHAIPVSDPEERERFYRDRIAADPAIAHLREAFDTWCAIWFWPADRLDLAPTPRTFENPPEPTRALVRELRDSILPLGDRAPRRLRRHGRRLRCRRRQPAVGDPTAELKGVFLQPRSSISNVRQAGRVA